MPFTLSHAAAAIPFRRSPLIVSALVVGCFVPDFSYFLTLSPHRSLSHTFVGMLILDLPLAIALLWLFHTFIKQPMLMFLPPGILRRLTTSVYTFPFRPWKRFSVIVLSILTGTATHLAWDAVTHRNTWFYRNWAFLQRMVQLPVAGDMRMYKVLEYASSILGLAIVAVWIWHWYRTTPPSTEPAAQAAHTAPGRAFFVALPAVATLSGALCAWFQDGIHPDIRGILHFTTDMLISFITIFLLGLLVCGMTVRQRRTETAGV